MQIYLVGGAVRDQLLGYPVKDKDYLVTGATVEQMLAQGFLQVGKSFPVFLHPETQQEYALARTEKKSGAGYTGFVCDFSSDINIEQDLLRRDLTVNAMAQDKSGTIIDPYGGQRDLENKVLRHVSGAFVEDPLRVLRVARFAARYDHLGFTIAPETLELMQTIVADGEMQTLIAERVWQETQHALLENAPWIYFQVLRQVGALTLLMPELDNLWGVPNPAKWHPEIDTGIHTMMALEQACKLSPELTVRFAVLTHDFGKALTPQDILPHHWAHEKSGLKPLKTFTDRLKVPNDCRELSQLVCEYHTHCHRALQLKPKTIIRLFGHLDAWRKPQRFEQFLQACTADLRGRTSFEQAAYPQADFLREMLNQANKIEVKQIVNAGYKGLEIRQQLTELRVKQVTEAKEQWLNDN